MAQLLSRRTWIGALIVYAIVLAVATHYPRVQVPNPVGYTDKIIHFGAFGCLTVLVWKAFRVRRAWVAGVALAAYAGIDEWTQQFVGRHTDIFDWVADTLGICVALALVVWLRRRQPTPSSV